MEHTSPELPKAPQTPPSPESFLGVGPDVPAEPLHGYSEADMWASFQEVGQFEYLKRLFDVLGWDESRIQENPRAALAELWMHRQAIAYLLTLGEEDPTEEVQTRTRESQEVHEIMRKWQQYLKIPSVVDFMLQQSTTPRADYIRALQAKRPLLQELKRSIDELYDLVKTLVQPQSSSW